MVKGVLHRETWALNVSTAIGVPVVLFMVSAVGVRLYLPMLRGTAPAVDLGIYLQAARQFVDDPLTLYGDVARGFVYPPLAILVFRPLVALPFPWAYFLVQIGLLASIVASWRVFVRLYEADTGAALGTGRRAACLLLALAFAPTLSSVKVGQIDGLVLLGALLFLDLLIRRRALAAGIVLACGIWLKLYPALLAGLGLRRGRRGEFLAGLAVGLLGLPIVALPWVPLALHRIFLLDYLPAVSGTTNLNGANQSILGILVRAGGSLYTLGRYEYVAASPGMRVLSALGAVVLVAGCYWIGHRSKDAGAIRVGFALLALVPLVSPLGWEHTYLFALPLCLYLLLESQGRGFGFQAGILGIALVFFIPKPPDDLILRLADTVWVPAQKLFYIRFFVADLAALLLAAVLWLGHGRES